MTTNQGRTQVIVNWKTFLGTFQAEYKTRSRNTRETDFCHLTRSKKKKRAINKTWLKPVPLLEKKLSVVRSKQKALILFPTSRHKVVNEESGRAAVLGGKEFAVRCGVGEGDLVFGQVTAEHEGAPGNAKRKQLNGAVLYCVTSERRSPGPSVT